MCHQNAYRRGHTERLAASLTPPLQQLPEHERNMAHSTRSPALHLINKYYVRRSESGHHETMWTGSVVEGLWQSHKVNVEKLELNAVIIINARVLFFLWLVNML